MKHTYSRSKTIICYELSDDGKLTVTYGLLSGQSTIDIVSNKPKIESGIVFSPGFYYSLGTLIVSLILLSFASIDPAISGNWIYAFYGLSISWILSVLYLGISFGLWEKCSILRFRTNEKIAILMGKDKSSYYEIIMGITKLG